jgi:hypothetical protein
MILDLGGIPMPATVSATLSMPRNYLPDPDLIGTGISWDYSYDLSISDPFGLGTMSTVPVEGTFTDLGMETLEIEGETMSAWRIGNHYTIEWSATDGIGPFTEDVTAEANTWWVEGLGMVQEDHTNTETGELLLEKLLVDWTAR